MNYRYFKEFELPKIPEFPENNVYITDFGAVPDGKTVCRRAVQSAIEHCASLGGGHVIFPKGNWLCGAIRLQNNIDLHFEEGSKILFSDDKKDYLPVVLTTYEAVRVHNYSPLIYGYKLKNVAITGNGTLDGNGKEWWQWKKKKETEAHIYRQCIEDTPVEQRVYGTEEWGVRSCFLELYECENILIDGINIENSSYWTVHPVWSRNITIRNVTIKSPYVSPNTDGINIDGCDTVLVENCTVLGGGDDIIAIKSGRGSDGWNMNKPCRNVIVRNCRGSDIRGGGIVIGSEMSGGVDNILAENCEFENISSCIKIKSKKGRGGYVRNIEYRNIIGKNVKYGIFLTMKYPYADSAEDVKKMPILMNYAVSGLKCDGVEFPLIIEGIDDCLFKNINIENTAFAESRNVATIEFAENVNITDTTFI